MRLQTPRAASRPLAGAIASVLVLGLNPAAGASAFPQSFGLADLDGRNGFVLVGEARNDQSGYAVSGAGDINGDGFDDVIVGARYADPGGLDSVGRTYVVFGSAAGMPTPFDLSGLDGSNGFMLDGEADGRLSGSSVGAAGDVNGDGVDDLVIGAVGAHLEGREFSGRSYVVFGSPDGFANPFRLADLDGTNGFAINGAAELDLSGGAVRGAGDINGDGIGDLLIGVANGDPPGIFNGGRTYVVFGAESGMPHPLELSSIDGDNGFVIEGEQAYDLVGRTVSAAGDFNGDGIDDLLVGASGLDANGSASGGAYVVFGSTSGLPHPLSTADIDGSNGIRFNGEAQLDYAGRSVSGAGDVNGDGIDDVIIGAWGAAPDGALYAGRGYVVFGSVAGMASPFELSGIDGGNGFIIDGAAAAVRPSLVVGGGTDLNGDGIDDLIVGAHRTDVEGRRQAGRTYVIFGSTTALPGPFHLADIDGSNGFALDGEAVDDWSGRAVDGAGDVNGDGIGDLILGAHHADDGVLQSVGRSYVVFGRKVDMFADGFEGD